MRVPPPERPRPTAWVWVPPRPCCWTGVSVSAIVDGCARSWSNQRCPAFAGSCPRAVRTEEGWSPQPDLDRAGQMGHHLVRPGLALASLGLGAGLIRDLTGSLAGHSTKISQVFWGVWDQGCVVSEDLAPWLWEVLLGSLSVTEPPCLGRGQSSAQRPEPAIVSPPRALLSRGLQLIRPPWPHSSLSLSTEALVCVTPLGP